MYMQSNCQNLNASFLWTYCRGNKKNCKNNCFQTGFANTNFLWIRILLLTSSFEQKIPKLFFFKFKKIKVCMPDCPISTFLKDPSPGWNLSPFTHLTMWIMKYLFILCVKSWLPLRGSCTAPDGERPKGYDWDAVKPWTHELFAIS